MSEGQPVPQDVAPQSPASANESTAAAPVRSDTRLQKFAKLVLSFFVTKAAQQTTKKLPGEL